MGLYPINCPGCGKGYMWFSGNIDQRCSECLRAASFKAASPNIQLEELNKAVKELNGKIDRIERLLKGEKDEAGS